MPIYEYACGACEVTFEMLVPSSSTTVACPRCQSGKVEKLFSSFAVRGRGAGGDSAPFTGGGMSGGGGGCCGSS